MPVALNNSTTPMPGSIAAAPGAAASAGIAVAGGLSASFLALLARMNVTLAPDAQAKVANAVAAFTDPADPSALPEIGELLDLTASETEKDKDTQAAEDEEAVAVLAIPALVLSLPVTSTDSKIESAGEGESDENGEAGLDPMGGKSGRAGSVEGIAEMTMRLLASQLLQTSPQQTLNPQQAAADRSGTGDATSSAAANSAAMPASNTVPSHLHALPAHVQSGADPAAPREIRAPLGTHAWTRQLGDELAWMAQQGRDSASLKLSPEHLGPLEVRISMREGEATVWFGAAHADTRNALEQALPRLREMFASQGLALADAGVFREAPRQQSRSSSFDPNASRPDSVTEVGLSASAAAVAARLLDTYA